MLHPSLPSESIHEERAFKSGKDFRRNAAAKENSAGGHHFESHVSGFRAVDRDKQLQGFVAKLAFSLESGFRDGGGRIRLFHFFDEPSGWASASAITQKAKYIDQARAG